MGSREDFTWAYPCDIACLINYTLLTVTINNCLIINFDLVA